MRKITYVLAVIVVFAGIPAAFAAEALIGSVVRCEGQCFGANAGTRESLTAGTGVRLMETVSTGAASRLELAFDDGTHVTLGEKAELVVDDFVYGPAAAGRFHAAIVGAFRYISASLGAGATRTASVTTPLALIGVRGTDFWGGSSNGVAGVVVFTGVVSVTTAAGTVILSAPGQGTNLTASSAAPSPVTQWSQDRIESAVAAVAFH